MPTTLLRCSRRARASRTRHGTHREPDLRRNPGRRQRRRSTRTLTEQDITLFAVMSGDINPAHVDPEYAKSSRFREVIGHGMWSGALISTVLGTEFPGPGTIYLGPGPALPAAGEGRRHDHHHASRPREKDRRQAARSSSTPSA
ncbi:MAG: MaoC family dehydratase [Comamonadaceae bacterium]|nr:MaoC family dehydratase [Comamonadaceae bacterium]